MTFKNLTSKKKISSAKNDLFCVILAGGSGTRLWPISRELYPKQLISLLGKKTLIQQTFTRLKKVTPADHILVVTNQAFATDIMLQLRSYGLTQKNLIIEPAQKNTAAAIGLAAIIIRARSTNACMLVCPADHLISPSARFIADVDGSIRSVKKGRTIVFGIRPSHPSPEYGYIKPRGSFRGKSTVPVGQFVEKPTADVARKYVEEGYFWNAGIFLFHTATVLREIAQHLPALNRVLAIDREKQFENFQMKYRKLKSVSIDNGILEKTKGILIRRATFRWQDIGSWKVLYELAKHDKDGNALNEHAITLDTRSSLIYGSPKRVVATIGVENLIIVDTEDAILVARQDQTHRIKEVYNKLKELDKRQYLIHPTALRPWGSYTVLEEGEHYKVKKISVHPGGRLSLQSHKQRSEHWVVISGTARATVNGNTYVLEPGQSLDVSMGAVHRLENPGETPLEIIEVQRGEYVGEDDIVRYEDKYRRI